MGKFKRTNMCCCVSDQCTKRLVGGLGVCTGLLGVIAFAFSINMVVQTGWLREAHGSGFLYSFQVWMTIILFVTSFVLTMMGGLSFAANYIQKGACTFCYGLWLTLLILALCSISLPILTVYQNYVSQELVPLCPTGPECGLVDRQ